MFLIAKPPTEDLIELTNALAEKRRVINTENQELLDLEASVEGKLAIQEAQQEVRAMRKLMAQMGETIERLEKSSAAASAPTHAQFFPEKEETVVSLKDSSVIQPRIPHL